MAVELHERYLVHRSPAPLVPDLEVGARGIDVLVVHQLAEHVDADSGVGVPLSVGMPVGIEEDLRLVELPGHRDGLAVDDERAAAWIGDRESAHWRCRSASQPAEMPLRP